MQLDLEAFGEMLEHSKENPSDNLDFDAKIVFGSDGMRTCRANFERTQVIETFYPWPGAVRPDGLPAEISINFKNLKKCVELFKGHETEMTMTPDGTGIKFASGRKWTALKLVDNSYTRFLDFNKNTYELPAVIYLSDTVLAEMKKDIKIINDTAIGALFKLSKEKSVLHFSDSTNIQVVEYTLDKIQIPDDNEWRVLLGSATLEALFMGRGETELRFGKDVPVFMKYTTEKGIQARRYIARRTEGD